MARRNQNREPEEHRYNLGVGCRHTAIPVAALATNQCKLKSSATIVENSVVFSFKLQDGRYPFSSIPSCGPSPGCHL